MPEQQITIDHQPSFTFPHELTQAFLQNVLSRLPVVDFIQSSRVSKAWLDAARQVNPTRQLRELQVPMPPTEEASRRSARQALALQMCSPRFGWNAVRSAPPTTLEGVSYIRGGFQRLWTHYEMPSHFGPDYIVLNFATPVNTEASANLWCSRTGAFIGHFDYEDDASWNPFYVAAGCGHLSVYTSNILCTGLGTLLQGSAVGCERPSRGLFRVWAFSDGQCLCSTEEDRRENEYMEIRELGSRKARRLLEGDEPARLDYVLMAATLDGDMAAIMHGDTFESDSSRAEWRLDIFNLTSNQRTLCDTEGSSEKFSDLIFTNLLLNGGRLWAWGPAFGHGATCWNASTGSESYRLQGHSVNTNNDHWGTVLDLRVLGQRIVTAGSDGVVRLWSRESGRALGSLLEMPPLPEGLPPFRLVRAEGGCITLFDLTLGDLTSWTIVPR